MYGQLLVALDGSPAAERVLEHAIALATAFGSRVTLLRATVSAEMVVAESAAGDANIGQVAPIMDPEPIIKADQETATDYLKGIAQQLASRNVSANVETPEGPASSVIVETARTIGANRILMTTHGRGGLGRVVFGSVADAVLRHAPCPVLLVRITDADRDVTPA